MERAELRPPRPGVLSGTAVWHLLASDDSGSETCGSGLRIYLKSQSTPPFTGPSLGKLGERCYTGTVITCVISGTGLSPTGL